MTRIQQIDALRGFALFGIIMTHMFEGYLASFTPPQYEGFNMMFPIDSISKTIIQNLFVGKFYAIFSLLFGLSFYMILDQKKDASAFKFAWRLLLLFVIAYIHHIHYRGDILTVYAIFGLALIPFRKVPTKIILILGLFLTLNGPTTVFKTIDLLSNHYVEKTPDEIAATEQQNMLMFQNLMSKAETYFEMIIQGEYQQLLASNSTYGFKLKFLFLKFSGRIWVIPGLFLLGLWAGRKKLHEKLEQLPVMKIITLSAFIGISLTLINYYYSWYASSEWSNLMFSMARDLSNFFMPLLYISVVLYLYNNNITHKLIALLAPVGKMGLTTYVSQTAFGLLIFYGYGFGLLLKLSGTAALGLGLLFFTSQIGFSLWWFNKFKFGPLEWLWRSLTYGKKQPFKVTKN